MKYTSRAVLVKEKVREDRLRDTGEAVVRWTFEQIEDDPDAVVGADLEGGTAHAMT